MFKFKKIASAITIFVFAAQSILPASALAVGVETPQENLHSLHFRIPSNLGRIDDHFAGTQKMIVHIQTAHGNYEAQKKIADILQFLEKEYGIHTFLTEGGRGRLDPELIRFFPHDKKRQSEALDDLTRAALIKGPELYLLNSSRAVGEAVEDQAAYDANGRDFARVIMQRKKSRDFMKRLDESMDRILAAQANPALRAFLERIEMKSSQKIPLDHWLGELKKLALTNLKVDFLNPGFQLEWPMMTRMEVMLKLKSNIDVERLAKEKSLFFKELTDQGVRGDSAVLVRLDPLSKSERRVSIREIRAFIQESLEEQYEFQLPDPETSLYFEALFRLLGSDFDVSRYPNLIRQMGTVILKSEIQPAALMNEIDRLEDAITGRLIQKEAEKMIAGNLKKYRLLQKIFRLELMPSEFEKMNADAEAYLPSGIVKSLEKSYSGQKKQLLSFEGMDKMDELYRSAMQFYTGVRSRDSFMLENIQSYMEQNNLKKVAVISGGFHAQPFASYFQEKDYSYVRLTPSITSADPQGLGNYIHVAVSEALAKGATRETEHLSNLDFLLPAVSEGALVRMITGGAVRSELVSGVVSHIDRQVQLSSSSRRPGGLSVAAGQWDPALLFAGRSELRSLFHNNDDVSKNNPQVSAVIEYIRQNWEKIREDGAFVFDVDETLLKKGTNLPDSEYSELTKSLILLLQHGVQVVVISGNAEKEHTSRLVEPLRKAIGDNNRSILQNLTLFFSGGARKVSFDSKGERKDNTVYNAENLIHRTVIEAALQKALKKAALNRFGLTPEQLREWWAQSSNNQAEYGNLGFKPSWFNPETGEVLTDVIQDEGFKFDVIDESVWKIAQEAEKPELVVSWPAIQIRGPQGSKAGSVTVKPVWKLKGVDPRFKLMSVINEQFAADFPGVEPFNVRRGGASSIDITAPHATKAYALKHFISTSQQNLGFKINPAHVFYFGDEFFSQTTEGVLDEGNDEPLAKDSQLKEWGVKTFSVGELAPQDSEVSLHIGSSYRATAEFLTESVQAAIKQRKELFVPESAIVTLPDGTRLLVEKHQFTTDVTAVPAHNEAPHQAALSSLGTDGIYIGGQNRPEEFDSYAAKNNIRTVIAMDDSAEGIVVSNPVGSESEPLFAQRRFQHFAKKEGESDADRFKRMLRYLIEQVISAPVGQKPHFLAIHIDDLILKRGEFLDEKSSLLDDPEVVRLLIELQQGGVGEDQATVGVPLKLYFITNYDSPVTGILHHKILSPLRKALGARVLPLSFFTSGGAVKWNASISVSGDKIERDEKFFPGYGMSPSVYSQVQIVLEQESRSMNQGKGANLFLHTDFEDEGIRKHLHRSVINESGFIEHRQPDGGLEYVRVVDRDSNNLHGRQKTAARLSVTAVPSGSVQNYVFWNIVNGLQQIAVSPDADPNLIEARKNLGDEISRRWEGLGLEGALSRDRLLLPQWHPALTSYENNQVLKILSALREHQAQHAKADIVSLAAQNNSLGFYKIIKTLLAYSHDDVWQSMLLQVLRAIHKESKTAEHQISESVSARGPPVHPLIELLMLESVYSGLIGSNIDYLTTNAEYADAAVGIRNWMMASQERIELAPELRQNIFTIFAWQWAKNVSKGRENMRDLLAPRAEGLWAPANNRTAARTIPARLKKASKASLKSFIDKIQASKEKLVALGVVKSELEIDQFIEAIDDVDNLPAKLIAIGGGSGTRMDAAMLESWGAWRKLMSVIVLVSHLDDGGSSARPIRAAEIAGDGKQTAVGDQANAMTAFLKSAPSILRLLDDQARAPKDPATQSFYEEMLTHVMKVAQDPNLALDSDFFFFVRYLLAAGRESDAYNELLREKKSEAAIPVSGASFRNFLQIGALFQNELLGQFKGGGNGISSEDEMHGYGQVLVDTATAVGLPSGVSSQPSSFDARKFWMGYDYYGLIIQMGKTFRRIAVSSPQSGVYEVKLISESGLVVEEAGGIISGGWYSPKVEGLDDFVISNQSGKLVIKIKEEEFELNDKDVNQTHWIERSSGKKLYLLKDGTGRVTEKSGSADQSQPLFSDGSVSIYSVDRYVVSQTAATETLNDGRVTATGVLDDTGNISADGEISRPLVSSMPALEEIRKADRDSLIKIGPGSLFTSLEPHFMQPEFISELAAAKRRGAKIVWLMNATLDNETVNQGLSDLLRHFDKRIREVHPQHSLSDVLSTVLYVRMDVSGDLKNPSVGMRVDDQALERFLSQGEYPDMDAAKRVAENIISGLTEEDRDEFAKYILFVRDVEKISADMNSDLLAHRAKLIFSAYRSVKLKKIRIDPAEASEAAKKPRGLLFGTDEEIKALSRDFQNIEFLPMPVEMAIVPVVSLGRGVGSHSSVAARYDTDVVGFILLNWYLNKVKEESIDRSELRAAVDPVSLSSDLGLTARLAATEKMLPQRFENQSDVLMKALGIPVLRSELHVSEIERKFGLGSSLAAAPQFEQRFAGINDLRARTPAPSNSAQSDRVVAMDFEAFKRMASGKPSLAVNLLQDAKNWKTPDQEPIFRIVGRDNSEALRNEVIAWLQAQKNTAWNVKGALSVGDQIILHSLSDAIDSGKLDFVGFMSEPELSRLTAVNARDKRGLATIANGAGRTAGRGVHFGLGVAEGQNVNDIESGLDAAFVAYFTAHIAYLSAPMTSGESAGVIPEALVRFLTQNGFQPGKNGAFVISDLAAMIEEWHNQQIVEIMA